MVFKFLSSDEYFTTMVNINKYNCILFSGIKRFTLSEIEVKKYQYIILKMTNLLRQFELDCLTQLVPFIDIEKEWIPLYREWLQKEHLEYLNLTITRQWMNHINKITGFTAEENISNAIYKIIEEYPEHTKNDIIFGIKLC